MISKLGGLMAAFTLTAASVAWSADSGFIGRWALTIPGGGAGWLGITEDSGQLKGSILWGGGSVVPVTSVKIEGDTLIVTRNQDTRKKDASGKTVVEKRTEIITGTLAGDNIKLTTAMQKADGTMGNKSEFSGKRIPALPAKPNLASLKFGPAVELFNGKDLTGWRLINPRDNNGWSVKEGSLFNNPAQEEGKPHKNYGNLRTEKEFEDFRLTFETRIPKGGNSGVYLRGIYEVQMVDSFGKKLDPHNMCGIYSRITPSQAVEKPAGEWQTVDITLADRHVTIILNGVKIIDNEAILGCTGGALWSDEFRPGPIYLQGDHTGAEYRNMILRPVSK